MRDLPPSIVWLALAACAAPSDASSGLDSEGSGGGSSTASESGQPSGPGTCPTPIVLTQHNSRISGQLGGENFERGWCGQDDGPEDVYVLDVASTVDVIIIVTSETELTALTLRVQEDSCAVESRVCATDIASRAAHFLAFGGHRYYITLDTPSGSSGNYGFDIVFGWPLMEMCDVHQEVIEQAPGESFLWESDLAIGQGRADGYCGGPGREDFFPLAVTYPGNVFAEVQGSGTFDPVISLRMSCAGASEVACDQEVQGSDGYASVSYVVDPAVSSAWYLAVDQVDHDGGPYVLNVYFD